MLGKSNIIPYENVELLTATYKINCEWWTAVEISWTEKKLLYYQQNQYTIKISTQYTLYTVSP